jgi:hypothetical protein
VANTEGDIPNFDNLDLLGDEHAAAEPTAEPAEPEIVEINEGEPAAAVLPAEEEAEPVRLADEKEEERKEHEPDERLFEEKEPSKLPLYLPVAVAIGLPVIALALALVNVWTYSTAVYVIALGFIPLGLWLGRKTNTVYVVIMGCVLAALLTAVYCLWMYLARYNFDVKAQDAKQRVSMVLPGRPESEWATICRAAPAVNAGHAQLERPIA